MGADEEEEEEGLKCCCKAAISWNKAACCLAGSVEVKLVGTFMVKFKGGVAFKFDKICFDLCLGSDDNCCGGAVVLFVMSMAKHFDLMAFK